MYYPGVLILNIGFCIEFSVLPISRYFRDNYYQDNSSELSEQFLPELNCPEVFGSIKL